MSQESWRAFFRGICRKDIQKFVVLYICRGIPLVQRARGWFLRIQMLERQILESGHWRKQDPRKIQQGGGGKSFSNRNSRAATEGNTIHRKECPPGGHCFKLGCGGENINSAQRSNLNHELSFEAICTGNLCAFVVQIASKRSWYKLLRTSWYNLLRKEVGGTNLLRSNLYHQLLYILSI